MGLDSRIFMYQAVLEWRDSTDGGLTSDACPMRGGGCSRVSDVTPRPAPPRRRRLSGRPQRRERRRRLRVPVSPEHASEAEQVAAEVARARARCARRSKHRGRGDRRRSRVRGPAGRERARGIARIRDGPRTPHRGERVDLLELAGLGGHRARPVHLPDLRAAARRPERRRHERRGRRSRHRAVAGPASTCFSAAIRCTARGRSSSTWTGRWSSGCSSRRDVRRSGPRWS